jgi:asparagine synthase (glutamine-hydrolysing)
MCGICGIINIDGTTVQPETLAEINNTVVHRGPDDDGIVLFDNQRELVGLAHRRLAIIDPSNAAHQPMGNEEGSIWITYNGEIYNYVSIAERLKAKGYRFRSNSDTEVILYAYEEWGIECLNQLNGMFAFGIWNGKQHELFLARDRLGIKPIHYFWDGKTFAFCSEIKGLANLLQSALRLNPLGLAFYSTLGYIPAPHTIYQEIRKLEPGHFIVLRNGGLIKKQYWDIDFSRKEHRSLKTLLQEIPQKLGEAVSSQLVSDVPLGAFLSGGIDSSAVVALMCQVAGERVKTFSIGFPEKDFDETPFACIVAERYKTDHYDFQVTPDAMSVFPRLVEHFGEPFADNSALPTYYLSAMTRNHVKVALSGDGGDELFCGYTVYLGHQISQLYRLLPRTLRKLILRCIKKLRWSDHYRTNQILSAMQKCLEDAELDPVKRVFSKSSTFPHQSLGLLGFNIDTSEVEKLFAQLLEGDDAGNFLDRISYLCIRLSLPDDILTKVDRMSMAHSLEVRVPFLDHGFVEYVATIPAEMRFRYWKTKWLLRKAMEPYLPQQILWRKKQGFTVPLSDWFRRNKSSSCESGIDVTDHRGGQMLWSQMIFTEWQKQSGGILR